MPAIDPIFIASQLDRVMSDIPGLKDSLTLRTARLDRIEAIVRDDRTGISGAGPTRGVPLRERLRPLQKHVLARPPTGQEADKAFYDEISGDA